MNTARQSIVDKLNTQSQFKLNHEELEFIIENWITIHSQNLSTATLRFNVDTGVYVDIVVNKDSIYKHF